MVKSISCDIIQTAPDSWNAIVQLKTGREILTQNADHLGFKMEHRLAAEQFCAFIALDNGFERPKYHEINTTRL